MRQKKLFQVFLNGHSELFCQRRESHFVVIYDIIHFENSNKKKKTCSNDISPTWIFVNGVFEKRRGSTLINLRSISIMQRNFLVFYFKNVTRCSLYVVSLRFWSRHSDKDFCAREIYPAFSFTTIISNDKNDEMKISQLKYISELHSRRDSLSLLLKGLFKSKQIY